MNDNISIIITTHNRLDKLKCAVDSVKKQSIEPFEIIIVNDGSSDGTTEYLETIDTENISVLNLLGEDSMGGNHARNMGAIAARGDYIAFLDDDDTWNEKKLELIRNKMISCKFDLLYSGYNRIIDNSTLQRVIPDPSLVGNLKDRIYFQILTVTSCLVIKKDLFMQVGGFDENLNHWQEFDLTIRLCESSAVVACINQPIVNINIDERTNKRLSNQVGKWEKSMSYFFNKYEYLKTENMNKFSGLKLIYYLDGSNRYRKTSSIKSRFLLMKAFKLTKKPTYFIRFFLNIEVNKIIELKNYINKFYQKNNHLKN